MGILSFGLTDVGAIRTNNEDSFCLDNEHFLYVVADGMGGHRTGEVASNMAVSTVMGHIKEKFQSSQEEINYPALLKEAIEKANLQIFELGLKDEKHQGMGTTIACLFLGESHLSIASVGDSRVYLVHQNELFQLTKDHTFVQEQLDQNSGEKPSINFDPFKNILMRAVGHKKDIIVDTWVYRFSPFDLFLICSDGLHGMLSDDDILSVLRNLTPETLDLITLKATVKKLVHEAKERGGKDNITAILVAITQ